MLGRGERPGHMTLRILALALVVVLALPATVGILRIARQAREPGGTAGRRRLEALWTLVPVVLLGALIVLAAAAGS
jgi:heme/copper-type cytochrome/quinol oxidase subunit 2